MPQDSIVRNVVTFVYMTALPLALCPSFAEARGVGVGFQSRAAGRATNPAKASPEMASQRTA